MLRLLRARGRWPAMALTVPGLATCFVAFTAAPHDQLWDKLTLLLAGCTVFASIVWVDLDDRLLVDASFVPSLLAIAYLGPAAAFGLAVAGELCSWVARRYRTIVVPINIFGLGAPALLGATVFEALQPNGAMFYVVLGAIGLTTLALNDMLVTSIIGILDDAPIVGRLRAHLKLVPALAINVALALVTASLYISNGVGAIAAVLVAIIAFNYMVSHMLMGQRRADRIAELAASRRHLVVEALDAEDRERRRLAERLHDEAIQDVLMARQDLAEARRGRLMSLERMEGALDRALAELRGAVFDLHPSVLEDAGLGAALRAVADQQGRLGRFEAEVHVDPTVPRARDRLLFAVSRELLRNVARHADAERASLSIACEGQNIRLDMRDDGRGFTHNATGTSVCSGHIGLASIMGKVDAAGGNCHIVTPRSGGAHVRVTVPADPGTPR